MLSVAHTPSAAATAPGPAAVRACPGWPAGSGSAAIAGTGRRRSCASARPRARAFVCGKVERRHAPRYGAAIAYRDPIRGVSRGRARDTKEPGRYRPVFLWLNVRTRSSTGLLSATRLRLGTWVDPGACRTHRRTGSHRATSDPVSYRPACDARHRPHSTEMTPNRPQMPLPPFPKQVGHYTKPLYFRANSLSG
jgi:hypothetical protein